MRKHELHVLTTAQQELDEVAAIASRCPTELIDMFHIREKQRSARELAMWYTVLKPLFAQSAIYINDRLDVALAVQSPGVQLGYQSLTIQQSRQIMPAAVRMGCSVHSAEEAVLAAEQGADYVFYGHVYETNSKAGLAPRGIATLAAVVAASPIPVIAIGGIDVSHVEEVLSTGCSGIALLSSILLHPEPAQQIIRYRDALNYSQYSPRRDYH
ncbi:thiazole tautomerase (transcriptional regulator TenI) [Paenibacillus sp. 1_12]|uniref:thiamine phosphate synthase n=1 Tax=Paenibacillus sp. 1_12 TaxID=1566278 RepID=UPI0008EF8981|nr:thiamine phosphate synthase [Paenibacillus sp. 1_12]SFL24675.1 thiazole tautomerase (transcriptional regulator TenI) [Paenibacillus sp. 1_12]